VDQIVPTRWAYQILRCWVVLLPAACVAEVAKIRGPTAPSKPVTILIQGGTFTMGRLVQSKVSAGYHVDERPLRVSVAAFRIGRVPITAQGYCLFLNSDYVRRMVSERKVSHRQLVVVSDFPASVVTRAGGTFVPRRAADMSPADTVTWLGAVLYCKWLSRGHGRRYRLPSEAEWEFAARGKEGRPWPWGTELPQKRHGYRWEYHPWDEAEPWFKCPVGSHPAGATPEGVLDMMGYVSGEWCANKYIGLPTAQEALDTGADVGDLKTPRVVRGAYHRRTNTEVPLGHLVYGVWHAGRVWTRVSEHPLLAPTEGARFGFRIVEEVATPGERLRGADGGGP